MFSESVDSFICGGGNGTQADTWPTTMDNTKLLEINPFEAISPYYSFIAENILHIVFLIKKS